MSIAFSSSLPSLSGKIDLATLPERELAIVKQTLLRGCRTRNSRVHYSRWRLISPESLFVTEATVGGAFRNRFTGEVRHVSVSRKKGA